MADVRRFFREAADGNKSKRSLQLVIQKSTSHPALKNLAKICRLGNEA
jgi:hypothetical protein